MSRPSRYFFHHQRGAALMVMLVIIVLGVAAVLVGSLNSTTVKISRDQTTINALARAKEALIGYAISYSDTHPLEPIPGYLPCPDITGGTSEGSSDTCGTVGANSMGRLPWKTLELPGIFDGQQDCLWYAVSGNYKNNPKYGGLMNWDTPAQLRVFDSNGNELQAGEVVAVIFSPGTPLSGNSDRSGTTAPVCGGNYTASAYLDNDTMHNINNADVSAARFIMPHEHRDASGNITLTTNDQFVFITRQDIWNTIQKRMAKQAKKCLDDYAADAANTAHKYPWAASMNDLTAYPSRTGTQNALFGRFPDVPSTIIGGGNGLTPSDINALSYRIQQVQAALDAYLANPSSTNMSTLRSKGDNLKDLARDPPYNQSSSDPARAAGILADNCTTTSCNTTNLQTLITAAVNDLSGTDGSMPTDWNSINACQQLISSPSWAHWRDLVYYQVADGFQPGKTGVCVSCLTITSTAPNPYSGTYHAAVAVSGKMQAGKARTGAAVSDATNYLEGVNSSGSTSLETYNNNDPAFAVVNDLVLCVNGTANCP